MLASLWLLNIRPLRKARDQPALPEDLPEAAAAHVADGARSARSRHGVVGRRAVHRRASLEQAARPRKRRACRRKSRPSSTAPCEELCKMLDDWDITTTRGDMPPQVWDYLKSKGFFAMIIPKKYGGLEFSAYAHSCVLTKIGSRSVTASSTVAVPNSLGPARAAEPLRHRRSEELLPAASRARRRDSLLCLDRPARGFRCRLSCRTPAWSARASGRARKSSASASTSRSATSRSRRSRTVVGLAFRLFDPDKLLGENGGSRHHLRAHSARHGGHHHRPPPLSARTFRSRTGRSRAAMCSCRSTSSSAGRR